MQDLGWPVEVECFVWPDLVEHDAVRLGLAMQVLDGGYLVVHAVEVFVLERATASASSSWTTVTYGSHDRLGAMDRGVSGAEFGQQPLGVGQLLLLDLWVATSRLVRAVPGGPAASGAHRGG